MINYNNYYSDMVAMVDNNYNTCAWLHASKRALIYIMHGCVIIIILKFLVTGTDHIWE